MIEEIKEKLLENKTLVAVLGTILVMLIGFFAWSNVTKTTADAQSDLPALSTTFSASSSASDLKTERSSSQTETQKVFVDIKRMSRDKE
ncbi:MAG: ComEA family DNA-binding protein, partial [Streptococcus gallolyticus]|nr:ComEA family DNA-binding protein [Streptococcus gallolyticus]